MKNTIATSRSVQLGDWSTWGANRTNREFFATALKTMETYAVGNGGLMTIGLVGSRDHPGIVLRRAQSILRWDRGPSLWSHAFLIGRAWNKSSKVDTLPIYEIPLHARSLGFRPPRENGLTPGARLGLYLDAEVDANVALIAVGARQFQKGKRHGVSHLSKDQVKAVAARAKDPNYDRLRYDFWESLSAWQRFLWSGGEGPNPLRTGVPVCASSYVEMAFEAIGLDLVPGASERNSAPEHIWNAAVWWFQKHGVENDDTESAFEMQGSYIIRDPGGSLINT